MLGTKFTKKQMFKVLEALELDYSKIERIIQPTDSNIVVILYNGYRITLNVFKPKLYAR